MGHIWESLLKGGFDKLFLYLKKIRDQREATDVKKKSLVKISGLKYSPLTFTSFGWVK